MKLKNPFPAIGRWFKDIPDNIGQATSKAITEAVEHGEAEVMDAVAGVIEDFDTEAVTAAIKKEIHKAVDNLDLDSIAQQVKLRSIEALNQRAAELRKWTP